MRATNSVETNNAYTFTSGRTFVQAQCGPTVAYLLLRMIGSAVNAQSMDEADVPGGGTPLIYGNISSYY